MKDEYARSMLLYRPIRTIERDLRAYALEWYNRERPHEGLAGRTPDDVHSDRPVRRTRPLASGQLVVSHVNGDRRLPIFRLRRVA